MALNTKYTKEETQIKRRIEYLQRKQKTYRNKWIEADMEIVRLTHSLKGKYKKRR